MSDELKVYLEDLNKTVADGFEKLGNEVEKTRIEIEILQRENTEIEKNSQEIIEFLKENYELEGKNQASCNIDGIL